jgi:sugar transferase (PEP-CTERM system associated)
MHIPPLRKLVAAAGDACVLFGTALLVSLCFPAGFGGGARLDARLVSLIVAIGFCLYYNDLYADAIPQRRSELLARIIVALATAGLLVSAVYTIAPILMLDRWVLVLGLPLACVALTAWRCLFYWVQGRDELTQNLLILGTGGAAIEVARVVLETKGRGHKVLGFVGDDPALVGKSLLNPCVIGTLDNIESLSHRYRIDSVIVAMEDRRGRLPIDTLMRCRAEGMRVEEADVFYESFTGRVPVRHLRPSSFIFSLSFNHSRLFRASKRAVDFLLALGVLVVALPLMALAGLLLWLESGWPVIYKQERVGQKGKSFVLHKLRTMRLNAEQESGPVWAAAERDPRITPIGRILRKTRLDELPQLFNVLKGEMSFVGPRPERPIFVEQLKKAIPHYDARHAVRPGITGWAQTRFTYSSTVEESETKLQYDLYYVKNMSLYLDMLILIDTAKVALLGKGAR